MGRNDFEGRALASRLQPRGEGRSRSSASPSTRAIVALLRRAAPAQLAPLDDCSRSASTPARLRSRGTRTTRSIRSRARTPPLAVSVIWALEDFTEENGATELIPGSHLWGTEHPDDARVRDGEGDRCPPGSALVFDGATWHRGGANLAVAHAPRDQPAILPAVAAAAGVAAPHRAARRRARRVGSRVRSMLGYNIHPPFVGQVDGMHPLRLVDPDYRRRKTPARQIADRVLTRPVPASDRTIADLVRRG